MEINKLYDDFKTGRVLVAGPCVIENEEMVLRLAEKNAKIAQKNGYTYIFKASFDKANRTSITSYRGPGLEEGLKILEKVKKEFSLPVLTDIHESNQADTVAEIVDVLQIPAFLCRQTDLLVSAAKTGKIVNIKKAQFLPGSGMAHPAKKVIDSGNEKILLTERGTIFGYGDLVVDFRQIADMIELGYPVLMDVTHSTQKPGGLGGASGGDKKYAPLYSRLAYAAGVRSFFFEVHEDPDNALSDGPNMITPEKLDTILSDLN